MSSERQIERQVLIETTPELAFEAVTAASELREWCCDWARAQTQPGGDYQVRWDSGYWAYGKFVELEAPRRAVLTWQGIGEPGETRVVFGVEPQADGVAVSLVHSGFGVGDECDQALASAEEGWTAGLENLKSILETGIDLRLARQPFLGINFEILNAERADREGIAAEQGIYVLSAVEGSGARAAGLDKGDVVVSIGGIETPGFQELGMALRARQAGDVVDVDLVRGQKRETIQVTLGQRPQPEVPDTAKELADVLDQGQEQANAELKAALEGVTDEEADQSPAEGEWSVKQVLAHLSQGERGFQFYLANVAANGWLDGGPLGSDIADSLLAAVIAATPTMEGLLNQFLVDQAQTVAWLRALPERPQVHKARFYRMAQAVVFGPGHTREHLEQIKNILTTVRGG